MLNSLEGLAAEFFAVPFEDIARLAGRSTSATKQLASRAGPRRWRALGIPPTEVAAGRGESSGGGNGRSGLR